MRECERRRQERANKIREERERGKEGERKGEAEIRKKMTEGNERKGGKKEEINRIKKIIIIKKQTDN